MVNVELKRYKNSGPNGDRATTHTKYYDYKVFVNGFEVAVFSGYDNFWTHVKNEAEVREKCFTYVEGLCKALGVELPDMYSYRKVEKTVVTWEKEDD